ncbi:MAG: FecR protein [Candidatus Omnitrophica bacterium ADurb.Bin277]|nr:MAG: FecR protein [Candidatus Omnitrophica bacterium ADurb.Bin277]
MKKIMTLLVVIGLIIALLWLGKNYLVPPVKTLVNVREGSVSVYYLGQDSTREHLGTLREGQSMEVRSRNRGFLAAFNIMKYLVPQAVTIFKNTIADITAHKQMGVYEYLFTEADFEARISSKLRKMSVFPDLTVNISQDGFVAGATLGLMNRRIPIYGSGIVGVDDHKYATMYLRLYEVKIGKFSFPKFFLRMLEDASNKVMGQGSFIIEIMRMDYRHQGINILYRKTEPSPRGKRPSARPLYQLPAGEDVAAPLSGTVPGEDTGIQDKTEPAAPAPMKPAMPQGIDAGTQYVTLRRPGAGVFVKNRTGRWIPAEEGMVLLPGDELRTAKDAPSVEVILENGEAGRIEVSGGSWLRIPKVEKDPETGDKTTLLDLAVGKMLLKVEALKGDSRFEVRTPTALTGVRGTMFDVEVQNSSVRLPPD